MRKRMPVGCTFCSSTNFNKQFRYRSPDNVISEINFYKEKYNIDEIQFAIIETCINAFEHSKSEDKRVVIKFIMRDNELELKITDHGVGFRFDQVRPSSQNGAVGGEMRKRGWGLEIIRNMMDDVNVESSNKGTTITMVKKKVSSK